MSKITIYTNIITPLIRRTSLRIEIKVPTKDDVSLSTVQLKSPESADVIK